MDVRTIVIRVQVDETLGMDGSATVEVMESLEDLIEAALRMCSHQTVYTVCLENEGSIEGDDDDEA